MNLNQVTLPTTDLLRSIEFYQLLGLELIVYAPPHYARFVCPEGGSTFSLHKVAQVATGNSPWIYFECQQLDQQVEKLIKQGVSFDLLPTDQSWLWREARLRDPDGNPLILYWAGENRINPPWRIPS